MFLVEFKSSPLMVDVEITTEKYCEKPVFSQLIKCEVNSKRDLEVPFKAFLLPKVPSRN